VYKQCSRIDPVRNYRGYSIAPTATCLTYDQQASRDVVLSEKIDLLMNSIVIMLIVFIVSHLKI
jgi:hypothetical protein